jgi:hypothetical protein
MKLGKELLWRQVLRTLFWRNRSLFMTSKALTHKLAAQRRAALAELPKVRLCARVVFAAMNSVESTDLAMSSLMNELGAGWSDVSAFQYMSGRQAQFAAECAPAEERDSLLAAHNLALEITGLVLTKGQELTSQVLRQFFAHLRQVGNGPIVSECPPPCPII